MGVRAVEKLTALVDREMGGIGTAVARALTALTARTTRTHTNLR
jgi:hypothetical protein